MLRLQLVLLQLPAIDWPECLKCAGRMILVGIEPADSGADKHTFECEKCEYSEIVLIHSAELP